MERLKDRVAVVTGTADGIGRAIALAFAREGARLAVCDVNVTELDKTADLLKQTGRPVLAECFDIRDAARAKAFVDRAAATWGRLDVLVNNAAIMPVGPVESSPEETIARI